MSPRGFWMLSRVRRRWAVAVALLTGVLLVPVGSYTTFTTSDAAGNWIALCGVVAFLLAVAAGFVALTALRSPTDRRRRTTMVMSLVAVAMVVPAGAVLAWALTASSRYDDHVADFPVDYPTTDTQRFDGPVLESQMVVRAWRVDGSSDEICTTIERAFRDWWDGTDVHRSPSSPACTIEASSTTSEASATVEDGRLVVAQWSRTDDLFVF